MSIQIKKTDKLIYGVTLIRHHLDTENVDKACGDTYLWSKIVSEINTDSFEYYNQTDGSNKFLKHIEINCYSLSVPYPDANYGGQVTYDLGNGNSKITCPFSDPNKPWLRSAISHEFGHCHHNWLRFMIEPKLADVRRWWDYEISIGKIVYTEPVVSFPWKQPDGSIQRDYEQYANSFRILFGTVGTRGDLELVPNGMNITLKIPELKKKFQLLPELCAMASAYGGISLNTLRWEASGFIFRLNSGHWIFQSSYNTWQWWNGQAWVSFTAAYTRD